jgi:hypothetical protein
MGESWESHRAYMGASWERLQPHLLAPAIHWPIEPMNSSDTGYERVSTLTPGAENGPHLRG